MPDSPIVGTHPSPPEDEQPDGVVLFDPTPPAPLEIMGDETATSWGHAAALIAVVLVVSLGGFLIYQRAAAPPRTVDAPVLPDLTQASRATALSVVGGPRLVGQAGSSVTLEVRASGSAGAPLADTLVEFRVTQGGGLLELEAARTNADGVARTVVLLPRRVGLTVVTAELAGADAATTLAVETLAGVPERIVPDGGDLQEAEVGELLPERLAVSILDGDQNPVPGADVRFQVLAGGGIAAPTRARTDSLGQASALWRLGPEPGTQRLEATSTALGAAVAFTATARGRPRAIDGTPLPIEAGPVTVERLDFVIGGSHVCRSSGGAATCRGANDRGQLGADALPAFRALATGVAHVCGLDDTGVAMCWGANEGGQLGDGSRTDRPTPVLVRAELRFASLTAGAAHTCGLAGGGIPLCWGQNLSGQLGDGSRTDARFPRAVGGGLTFRSLVAGWSHTCGLTANGNAFCWGLNGDGQLGDGSRLDRLVPTLVRGAIESLTAGSAHTCGISEGQVLCWGDNRFGQLGDGSTEGKPQPTRVAGLPAPPIQVAAGAVHTCALVALGGAYCWGQNLQGQLGDGTTVNRNAAVPVGGGLRFRSLHAGGAMTCASAMDGGDYCWGLNQSGQLGDGTRQSRSTPTLVRN
jgi:hypothetical protein